MADREIQREDIKGIVTSMPRKSMIVRIHADDCGDKFSEKTNTLRGEVVAVRGWFTRVKVGDWVNFRVRINDRGYTTPPLIIDLDRIGLGRFVIAELKQVIACVRGGSKVDFTTEEREARQ